MAPRSGTRCSRWRSAGSAAPAGACPACTVSTPATTGNCSATSGPATASRRSSASSGVEVKESKFSGRLVLQYVEASYSNQRGELVARALGTCTRHERKAARDAGKYKDIKTYEYTPEEFERIDAGHSRRGARHPRQQRALLGGRDRKAKSCPDRARPAFADGYDGLPRRLRPRPHARRRLQGRGEASRPLLPQSGSGRRHRIYRHRPPSRVGRQGSRRAGHLRLRPAAFVLDVQPRDQLDGRCGLPEARAHRDAPLQHDGRFDLVQGHASAANTSRTGMRSSISRSAARTSAASSRRRASRP